jgi:tRNA A-37 threonylcarbamoyl transferase component Bud32
VLPKTFGPYVVTAKLGQGGMGAVFRARHPNLPVEVAVKALRSDTLGDADAQARFRAEVTAVARVQHPNVVPVIDAGRAADGSPYYVMPLVVGRPLSDVIAKEGPLEPRVAASYAARIARGLHAVHTLANALHRDLKPSNVILETATGEPKLFDFGLARSTSFATAEKLTATGTMIGTPEFMAPEQCGGPREETGVPTDVYGLGAFTYALVTGLPPIEGGGRPLVSVLTDVCTKDPRPPHVLRDAVPRDLSAIVLQALAKKPADRYPTALAFAEDLERFGRGDPVLARPPGASVRVGRALSSRAPWVALVGVLGLALALAVVWFVQRTRELEQKAQAEREQARRELEEKAKALEAALAAAKKPTPAPPAQTPAPTPAAVPAHAPLSERARDVLEKARLLEGRGANAFSTRREPKALAQALADLIDGARADLAGEDATIEAATLLARANLFTAAAELLGAAVAKGSASSRLLERAHLVWRFQKADCTVLHAAIRAASGDKRDAYALAVDADEALASGNPQAAHDALEQAREAGPPGLASLALMGTELYLSAHYWTHSEQNASQVLRDYPHLAQALHARGYARLYLFDGAGALEDLEGFGDMDADSYDPVLASAFAAEIAGSWDKALALAERAGKVQHDSLALYVRGAALEGLGRADDAKAGFDEAIKQDLWCARAHLGLTRLALDRVDLATANAEWDMAKQCFAHEPGYNRDPLNGEAFLRTLVHAGQALKDPEQAARVKKALEPFYPQGQELPARLQRHFRQLGL